MDVENLHVSISEGNEKLGSIHSVSLPPGVTCRKDAPCFKDPETGKTTCYVYNYYNIRSNVREAYERNLKILQEDPDRYFHEVMGAMILQRYFRFHVSGDIPDMDYFKRMVDICYRVGYCQVLCMTKQYEIVNDFVRYGGNIPSNLHIVFSKWKGLVMPNPYLFPEAHVRYKDGTTTACEDAFQCEGNCTRCVLMGEGCWSLKQGDQVVFDEH